MRKLIMLALMVSLLATALGGSAVAGKKAKTRVAESKYEAPAIGTAESGGVCFRPTNSCGDIAIGSTEIYAKVEIIDATGTASPFTFGQDTDPDALGTETTYGDFCGNTGKKAIKVEPGLPLVVFPWMAGPSICPGGFSTQGTVKVTLSNKPF